MGNGPASCHGTFSAQSESSAPAGEQHPALPGVLHEEEDDTHICIGCGEILRKSFDQEEDVWVYEEDCVRWPPASNKVFHRSCLQTYLQANVQ